MTLRVKTLNIVGVTLVGLILVLYAVSRIVLLRSFAKLEEENTRRDVERALSALSADLSRLASTAGDYAAWDQTYAFMKDRNHDYPRMELKNEALAGLKVNFVLLFDPSGRRVFRKGLDLRYQKEISVPENLSQLISGLPGHPRAGAPVTGIVLVPNGPLLIAWWPILTTERKGPTRGTLVMARYLDRTQVTHLAETARLSLALKRLDDSKLSAEFQTAYSSLVSGDAPILVRPLSAKSIAGYALLRDVGGKPILVLKVDVDRAIYERGRASLLYFLGSLLMAGLVFGVVTLVLLEKVVLARLTHLNASVSRIGASRDLSARVRLGGRDELSSLAGAVDGMLEALEQSQKKRQEAEEMLRRSHDELETRVGERTAELAGANATLKAQIAERERAEQALAHERDLFHTLMDNVPDTIFFKDTASRFTRINKAAARLLGIREPEEALGRTDVDFFPAELAREFRAEEEKLVKTGQPLIGKIEKVERADGQITWFSCTEAPIKNNEGQVIGIAGISRDITESKRAEQALTEAKAAAEAASRAKSEFLANMSHEIRTPMNGVIGMTELALDTELTPEQRDYLAMVRASADSLLTVINDILDFSKIEAGKLDLDHIEFDLRDSLGETLRTLAVRAHQKGLELSYDVRPEVPERLLGDPTRLRQIVINLVSNAVKFTERGEVIVRVGQESRSADKTCLHFDVVDTGIGIPAEKQNLIFEAFSQADGSATRKYGGTGLGLTISSQLIQMMGGRIWVESEVGKGSTFHFIAQFGVPGAPQGKRAPEQPETLRGMAVLVVDDNATNRRILEEILRHWQMQPALADGGWTALAALQKATDARRPFPLVLIDAQMPEMDGFTLAEKIKQNPALAGATVMMLTSAGQRGDAARCRELGVAAYLTKPVKRSDLLEAILIALGKPSQETERRPLLTRHSIREARQGLRVLLAEDNPVNQTLAVRLLEKRGHSVVVATNGKEALAALERQAFDLALMDVQMPEMDGFRATAAIRESEKATGRHLPIIALTAHAMKGDRERCLAADMDGYISKPIQAKELFETIEGLHGKSAQAEVRVKSTSRSEELLDRVAALGRVEGDGELLSELVRVFLGEWPRRAEDLRRALEDADARALARAAHTLKGSVGNFAARRAWEAAERLERMAQSGDLKSATGACAALEEEIERLKPALAGLMTVGAR